MKNYTDVVLINTGSVLTPAAGASVTVLNHASQTNAIVYGDDGITVTSNPLVTDNNGRYNFFVADGRYDLKFSGNGFTGFTQSNIEIADVTENTPSADATWNVGALNLRNLNSVILFADQFAGSDASAKIQAAINALPAIGGTVDARALTDSGGTGSTTIDPGTKAISILLGPGTYNFSQVILRRALHIIGMGAYPANGTIIQATGGNSTPPFVIDQAIAAQDVILQGFALQGTPGNTTQNGISLVLPASSSTGLWYSEFNDLYINGFGGIGLNMDASAGVTQGTQQFNTFKRVIVIRPSGGNYALQIIGRANSLKFENCEFDGTFNVQDGKTNIFIGQGPSNANLIFPPYNIKFDLVTCQFAGVGFNITGAQAVSIDQGHFEGIQQAFSINAGAQFGDYGISIHDSGFGSNTGVGTASPGVGVGNGYIIKNFAPTSSVSLQIIDSQIFNTPDAFLLGNTGSITSIGNTIGPSNVYQTTLLQAASGMQLAGQLFANLGTPLNGTIIMCSDCTIANPCTGGGTGAFAKRLNGVWVCN